MIQRQNIPDDEGEESSNNEDIIKHGKSDEEPMESLSKFFPLHNKYSDGVAWKHDDIREISYKIDEWLPRTPRTPTKIEATPSTQKEKIFYDDFDQLIPILLFWKCLLQLKLILCIKNLNL